MVGWSFLCFSFCSFPFSLFFFFPLAFSPPILSPPSLLFFSPPFPTPPIPPFPSLFKTVCHCMSLLGFILTILSFVFWMLKSCVCWYTWLLWHILDARCLILKFWIMHYFIETSDSSLEIKQKQKQFLSSKHSLDSQWAWWTCAPISD